MKKHFTIDIKGQQKIVLVDHLKPAHLKMDSISSPSLPTMNTTNDTSNATCNTTNPTHFTNVQPLHLVQLFVQ